MTLMCDKDAQFIENFINIYRQNPALWKIKSKAYSDRNLRSKGYDELLNFYKTVCPSANMEAVRKKINNLRCSFRKELKKVNASKKSGGSTDDVYKPTLWYFNILSFTADQEETRDTQSSLLDELSDNEGEENYFNSEVNSPVAESSTIEVDEGDISVMPTPKNKTSTRKGAELNNPPNKKRRVEDEKVVLLKKLGEALSQPEEDECSIAGRRIGLQLKGMSENQRFIAEKLISDITCYGRCGKLNENVTISFSNTHPSSYSSNYNYNSNSNHEMYAPVSTESSTGEQLHEFLQLNHSSTYSNHE